MKKDVFIALPDDSCKEFIAFLEGKIEQCRRDSQQAAAAFTLNMDEKQRGVALLAAGSQAAYEDVLREFKQGMGLKYGKN